MYSLATVCYTQLLRSQPIEEGGGVYKKRLKSSQYIYKASLENYNPFEPSIYKFQFQTNSYCFISLQDRHLSADSKIRNILHTVATEYLAGKIVPLFHQNLWQKKKITTRKIFFHNNKHTTNMMFFFAVCHNQLDLLKIHMYTYLMKGIYFSQRFCAQLSTKGV